MAVNRDPILKRCRYLGISPTVVGINKESFRKPNANGRRKVSEYGLQLKEKQKLKFIYGVLEKQFYHYYEIATKMEGQAGTNLIVCLETRLDNIIFRMGMAQTRRDARQVVTHGHFLVNGNKVDIPSYGLKVGDVVELREKSRKTEMFVDSFNSIQGTPIPYIEKDVANFKGTVARLPQREELPIEINEQLIVEFYSKTR